MTTQNMPSARQALVVGHGNGAALRTEVTKLAKPVPAGCFIASVQNIARAHQEAFRDIVMRNAGPLECRTLAPELLVYVQAAPFTIRYTIPHGGSAAGSRLGEPSQPVGAELFKIPEDQMSAKKCARSAGHIINGQQKSIEQRPRFNALSHQMIAGNLDLARNRERCFPGTDLLPTYQ